MIHKIYLATYLLKKRFFSSSIEKFSEYNKVLIFTLLEDFSFQTVFLAVCIERNVSGGRR